MNVGDMMNNEVDFYVEFEEPVVMGSMGWYIGSFNLIDDDSGMYYYLHDDGCVYEGCAAENGHTGWFANEPDAIMALAIYIRNNITEVTNNIESQTMDFK